MTNLWKHMIAGGLASCLSRTLLSPMHVISHRQAFERLKDPRARVGMGAVVGKIVKEGGLAGFWRGNALQCIHGFPDKGLTFFFYEGCYRSMRTREEDERCFLSGAIAGFLATVALYPVETISSRVCVSYPGEMYRGLYNGVLPAVMSMAPTMGITFAIYHRMKRDLGHGNDPRYTMAYAGVASSVACLATWPLYGLRQRMYLCEGRTNLWALMSHVLEREGVRGLYVGCMSNTLKLIPKSAIQMTAYERLTKT